MSHHSTDHGDAGGHGAAPHLPDPSLWPFVVGAATLLLGLALVWWTRDRSNNFTGPVLGGAVVFTLIAAAGWAYEDGRMRKKAEQGELEHPRNARYTQVLTFAIADGELLSARGAGGVIEALQRSDNALHNLAGFQDLRIIASATEPGPTQVLVETTWADRAGLATYEETRRTLLDLVNAHSAEIVPGSVQVFDMEVVRDTKDVGFRFGMGAAATVVGSLVLGGFMVGAGLSVFQKETKAAAGTATSTPAAGGADLIATDNKFNKSTIEAPPNAEVAIVFKNSGKIPHNVRFLTQKGGQTLTQGAEGAIIDGGKSETLKFKTPAVANYYYQCDVHPTEMTGTFVVKDGVPAPGATPAGGATPAASPTGTATATATR